MKRLLLFFVLCLSFTSFNNQACQAECKSICGNRSAINQIVSGLYSVGKKMENAQLPVVGKLGNFLPVAVIAFCLQKFPGQTAALVACGMAYGLLCNEKVRGVLGKHKSVKAAYRKKSVKDASCEDQFDESFFIFSGEDLLDAEEEENDEEDLLDEFSDEDIKSPVVKKKPLSFL